MKIELIYDDICPNFEAARNVLRIALVELGMPLVWQEWNRSEHSAPSFVYKFGSPTILVNGIDIAGTTPESPVHCCRLYEDPTGHLHKVPSIDLIVQAIQKARDSQ